MDLSFDDLIPGAAPRKPDLNFDDLVPSRGTQDRAQGYAADWLDAHAPNSAADATDWLTKNAPGRPQATTGDRAQALASGVNKGVMVNAAGLPVDTALNVWDLLKAGAGYAGSKLGILSPDQLPQLTDRRGVFGSSDYIANAIRTAGGASMIDPNAPQDMASRLLSAGGQGVGATMVGGGAGTGARNLLMGGASQSASQLTAEAGGSPAAQVLASFGPQAAVTAPAMLPRAIARGGAAGQQQMQDRMATLSQGGVDNPSVGLATGNARTQWLESLLGKLPGSGGVMSGYGKDLQGAVGDRVAQIRNQASSVYGPEAAGMALQDAVKGPGGYKDKMNRIYGLLDDRVGQYIDPNAMFPVSNTLAKAQELTAPILGAPNTSATLMNPRINAITASFGTDAANNAGQMPYAATQALASKVGQESRSTAIVGTPEQGALKQLYSGLAADKMAAANASDPSASAALSRANNFYSGARTQLDALQPFVNTSSPERSFNMLASTARTAPSLVASVMGSVPGSVRQIQAATVIDGLGRATPGNQNAEGSNFSTNTFLTNWNKIPDPGKAALLSGFPGADSVRSNLNKVAQTAAMIKSASGVLSNPSGTAPAVANMGALTAAGAAALTGHLGVAAGILGSAATANVSARLMTNPIFANWLAQSTQVSPSQIQQHISRLAINASMIKDPQTKAEMQQFVNSLSGELRP
jgi:hypothetical protein